MNLTDLWYRLRRGRRRRQTLSWKAALLHRILGELLPPSVPYLYQPAPSFLQAETLDTEHPVRIDLFLPDYPLALDLVGAEAAESYRLAAPSIARRDWERLQAEMATKRRLLAAYGCPYLVLREDEPGDLSSLNERLRAMLGRPLLPS